MKLKDILIENSRHSRMLTYDDVVNSNYNKLPTNDEELINVLNTFDTYAEMSDDSTKNDDMRRVVRYLKPLLTPETVRNIQSKLDGNGKNAIKRYF